MQRGYVVQIYPNKAQKELLGKHFGCARWVYNHMINVQQKRYHRTGKGMSGYDLQNMLPKIKKKYPWLADVNSQSLQIVCHDLAGAYTRFFKKKARYPVFKKKGHGSSFTCINGSRLDENHIRLPKLGEVRYRGGKQPSGEMKRFTVRERAGKFYCSILFDDGHKEPKKTVAKQVTGIDMGLTDMVTTSNGDAYAAPKFMKTAKRELRRKQKALSRCVKGSKRRAKAKLHLAVHHQKIRNQRKDFNHKLSHSLVQGSDNQTAFAMENLNVTGMMRNHKLARSIADAGWSQFKTFLTYKAAAVGKQVIEVDRFFPSSKTCSDCGLVRESLALSERTWTCECGVAHQRDINAARNIALEALRNSARRDRVSL